LSFLGEFLGNSDDAVCTGFIRRGNSMKTEEKIQIIREITKK
jgi:hypothetical protein